MKLAVTTADRLEAARTITENHPEVTFDVACMIADYCADLFMEKAVQVPTEIRYPVFGHEMTRVDL